MARFLMLKLLLLNALHTGVYCIDQAALQQPVQSSPLKASGVSHTPLTPRYSELTLTTDIASCNNLYYAALGDSYSAGLASWYPLPICNKTTQCPPNDCTSTLCARNTGAFGRLFAQRYRPYFQFLACTGADTTQIQSQQVSCLQENTNLVTLTAGGDNNNIFADVVKYCVYETIWEDCGTYLQKANKTIQGIDSDIVGLWQAIKRKAPAAKIYHLGYARFWPSDYDNSTAWNCQDDFLNAYGNHTRPMNALVDALNNKIRTLAQNHGVIYVSVDQYFEVHRFCDKFTSWFLWRNVLSNDYHGGVFHPTEAGQEFAYLKAFESAVGCNKPLQRNAEEILGIEYEL